MIGWVRVAEDVGVRFPKRVRVGTSATVCATMPEANWSKFSFLLGQISVQTTERYLGCKQHFREAVNDHIGLGPDAPS
jgi:hypothetical protein